VNRITVKATKENMTAVMAFLDEELEKADCMIKAQTQVDVAVDEVYTNIASYAYPSVVGDATIEFEVDDATGIASITFRDQGIPYNPLEKEDPDINLPAEERPIGGLGIFLVRKLMDEVLYRYENGSNILTIRKKIR
jgi:anti-sigma regulatory factor (Ser/Thr protein kinase)